MALYLVLRHKNAPDQAWKNDWHDDMRISQIETNQKVADACKTALKANEKVFIYRTVYADNFNGIVCCGFVESLAQMDNGNYKVIFKDVKECMAKSPRQVGQGMQLFLADPVKCID